jgi:hypothetical protein
MFRASSTSISSPRIASRATRDWKHLARTLAHKTRPLSGRIIAYTTYPKNGGHVLVPFWKIDMMAFQAGLCVIQTQDVDAKTTRPSGQYYEQDETLSILI